jgi:hypothetical protein
VTKQPAVKRVAAVASPSQAGFRAVQKLATSQGSDAPVAKAAAPVLAAPVAKPASDGDWTTF